MYFIRLSDRSFLLFYRSRPTRSYTRTYKIRRERPYNVRRERDDVERGDVCSVDEHARPRRPKTKTSRRAVRLPYAISRVSASHKSHARVRPEIPAAAVTLVGRLVRLVAGHYHVRTCSLSSLSCLRRRIVSSLFHSFRTNRRRTLRVRPSCHPNAHYFFNASTSLRFAYCFVSFDRHSAGHDPFQSTARSRKKSILQTDSNHSNVQSCVCVCVYQTFEIIFDNIMYHTLSYD